MATTETQTTNVVLYDGTCGFCHASVQWLLAHDPKGLFVYAPLQGSTAASLRARHPTLPSDLDSVIFVEAAGGPMERVWWRSHAVFRLCSLIGGVWGLPGLLRFLPRPLTDFGYDLVARSRHRLAPPVDACALPSPEERARFLP